MRGSKRPDVIGLRNLGKIINSKCKDQQDDLITKVQMRKLDIYQNDRLEWSARFKQRQFREDYGSTPPEFFQRIFQIVQRNRKIIQIQQAYKVERSNKIQEARKARCQHFDKCRQYIDEVIRLRQQWYSCEAINEDQIKSQQNKFQDLAMQEMQKAKFYTNIIKKEFQLLDSYEYSKLKAIRPGKKVKLTERLLNYKESIAKYISKSFSKCFASFCSNEQPQIQSKPPSKNTKPHSLGPQQQNQEHLKLF